MRTFSPLHPSFARVASVVAIACLAACKSTSTPDAAGANAPASTTEAPPSTASTSMTNTTPPATNDAPAPALAAEDEDAVKADAGANANANAFAVAIYRNATPPSGNALVSGASLRAALGIAYLGARGETAQEMRRALHLDAEPDASTASAKADAAAWNKARGEATLAIVNRLWADKDKLRLEPSFAARAKAGYGAGVELVPFATAPEAARTTVNTWVSEQTNKKIPELLPGGSITELTRLIVTNAVYFKAAWQSPFKAEKTSKGPFKVDGAPTTVTMMHQRGGFAFAALDGIKVLELPYAKSELAMTILLPDDTAGLGKLERALTTASLERWTSAPKWQEVEVTLPKFTFQSGGSVKKALETLGMKRAFNHEADFKGIATEPADLYVDDVVHKTFVAVDENGTEAAAASAVVMATRGIAVPMPAVEFKADHPFLFIVRDTKTGRILFLGRVTHPKT